MACGEYKMHILSMLVVQKMLEPKNCSKEHLTGLCTECRDVARRVLSNVPSRDKCVDELNLIT